MAYSATPETTAFTLTNTEIIPDWELISQRILLFIPGTALTIIQTNTNAGGVLSQCPTLKN